MRARPLHPHRETAASAGGSDQPERVTHNAKFIRFRPDGEGHFSTIFAAIRMLIAILI
jgi:hypothetical protein